ncbi:MAG: hypothetical protein J7L47_02670 [Candidatus Odinarchaeota archaeon]|nr:hypothetical protein [Candidatus Odinarchaeota archaeon]
MNRRPIKVAKRRTYTIIGVVLIISIIFGFYVLQDQQKVPSGQDVYILVNQVGYFTNEQKVAIIRTNEDLAGQKIKLINMNTSEAIDIDIGPDLGEGYNFNHHFIINFTEVKTTGTYYFELGDIQSYTFRTSH